MKRIKTSNSKQGGVYHTNPECHMFQQMTNHREATENEIEHYDMTECRICQYSSSFCDGGKDWNEFNAALRQDDES